MSTFVLDLFGVSDQDKMFFLDDYLPKLEIQTQNVTLSVLEKAELLENTAGTLIKIFYAFFWQESIIDLGGETPSIEDLTNVYSRSEPVARGKCLRSCSAAPPQHVRQQSDAVGAHRAGHTAGRGIPRQ